MFGLPVARIACPSPLMRASDIVFANLGFLYDVEVLLLASASAGVRRRMVAARSAIVPIQLLPGVGLHGLWNHFEFWEVALYLGECANLTIPKYVHVNMCLRTARSARTFLAALHLAKKPYKRIAPWMVKVASVWFPRCDLSADGEFAVRSSPVFLLGLPESVCLKVNKEWLPHQGEYGLHLYLWRAGGNGLNYSIAAVSAEYGTELTTDFSQPPGVPWGDRGLVVGEWLSGPNDPLLRPQRSVVGNVGPNNRLRRDIEAGRPMMFIVSVFDMSRLIPYNNPWNDID